MDYGVGQKFNIRHIHDLLRETRIHGGPCTVCTDQLRCNGYELFQFLHRKPLKLLRVGDKSDVE